MGKKVFMTGVSGFIGANCLEWFLKKTDWTIVSVASYKHKGQTSRLEEIKKRCNEEEWERFRVYRHDLTAPIDPQLENLLLERSIDDRGVVVEKPIDIILNFASDSAVERSVTDPTWVWHNNCQLMATMLEFARKIKDKLKLFLHVSTDEVYGECFSKEGHKEWAAILPSNSYAGSKAAQEALVISYWRSYDLPVVITNCANVIGPFQAHEKFLPKIIQFVATDQKEMPIYADLIDGYWKIGSRIYLDVRDKADALVFLAGRKPVRYSEGAMRPDRYNITGEHEVDNLEFAQLVAKAMGKKLDYKLVPSESVRPGYDRRYALDGSKLREMGWKSHFALNESIRHIVDCTTNNPYWLLEK